MAEIPWHKQFKTPKPQSLDQTADDLKRIGTGLLVGETADILGLPADLLGLYQDVVYGKTSKGAQEFIDEYGSEALAKKFMGEEFPEFGMNLESFGRVVAPGALLSKGIMSARILARGGKPPPSGLAMATVGGGKLVDDVPPTTAEQLMMTKADDGRLSRIDTGEDDFFKSDVDIESRLDPDGIVFSNLIDFIAKDGLGIEFTKNTKSSDIMAAFANLKKGDLKNRLNAELKESGLIRLLENNPNEVFSSKDQLIQRASLFNPTVKISAFSTKQQDALVNKQKEILNRQAADPENPTIKQELDVVNAQLNDYATGATGKNALANMDSQLIPMAGGGNQLLVRDDAVNIIFHGGEGDNYLLGKKIGTEKISQQDQLIAEVENYFKAMGDTTELKKLEKLEGKLHGFGNFPGYWGHIRAFGAEIADPDGSPNTVKALILNELQTNQAEVKGTSMMRENQKALKTIQELEEKMKNGTITPRDQDRLDKLKAATSKSAYGDMMTGEKRMDALQIFIEDQDLETGFMDYTAQKTKYTDDYQAAIGKLNQAEENLTKLQSNLIPLKKAMFKVDEQVNRDRLALKDFKNAKEKLYDDLIKYQYGDPGFHDAVNPDVQMPEFLASMLNVRAETGPINAKPHFTTKEYYSIMMDKGEGGLRDPVRGRTYDRVEEPMLDENLKKMASERYGTEGNVNPLVDILGGQDPELLQDLQFQGATGTVSGDYAILDFNMLKDYYRDLVKAYNENNLTKEMFETLPKHNVTYNAYVKVKKAANGDDYFMDPANYQKTTRYILNDKEKRLENSFLKTKVMNKVMNDPTFLKSIDETNINEIRTRLFDANTKRNNETDFDFDKRKITEQEKIFTDFQEDIGMGRISVFSKTMNKAVKETLDDWAKEGNKMPRTSPFADTKIAEQSKGLLGVGEKKYVFDEDAYNKANMIASASRSYMEPYLRGIVEYDNFGTSEKTATAINSLVAKQSIQSYDKQIKYLNAKVGEAEDVVQESNRKLSEFEDKNDRDEILKSLKDQLPEKLKKNLDAIVDHQIGKEPLLASPPISNTKQGTELMIHGLIKKAKELGYERVVIPNVQSYAAASGREGQLKRVRYGDTRDSRGKPLTRDEVPYGGNIGENATETLKKYGNAYSEADSISVKKKPLIPAGGDRNPVVMPPEFIKFGQDANSSEFFDVPSEDRFRIINLTNEDVTKKTNLRIPRMAKGGIFEKFRKAS